MSCKIVRQIKLGFANQRLTYTRAFERYVLGQFGQFHVMKLYSDRLSELRRHLQRKAEGPLQIEVLKGTLCLLLKNPENLNILKDENGRLQKALKLNEPLASAYYLKEDLRQLWNQKTKTEAEKHLTAWIAKAMSSKETMLIKMAKTLQRQAYGFRDIEIFKLIIFGLYESKYALIR